MTEEAKIDSLNLEAVIGFGGAVPNGLVCHPDGEHIIYPLGSTIVIRNTKKNTQAFLQGHTDEVTCLAVSKDGRFIASGQKSAMGFKAPVIIWDCERGIANANTSSQEGEILHKLLLHKVHVRDVCFSESAEYLATLGGQDDNSLVVWEVASGDPVCGSPAASHSALTVRWFNNCNDRLLTAGHYNLRTWEFDKPNRKLRPTDCHLGTLKRVIRCVAIDDEDKFAYCGTKTGDMLEVNVQNGRFSRASRNRFSLGTTSILFQRFKGQPRVICGNGDGSVAMLDMAKLGVEASCLLEGEVTSLSTTPFGTRVYAGTAAGNTYSLDAATLAPELRSTAHPSPVTDISFPRASSELFVTAAGSDIRLWNAYSRQELLRIQVPNLVCNCVQVAPDGASIISGWSDGKIRSFLPESGKLKFVITDAHAESVTAIACTSDSRKIVSGGKDGRVRMWDISGQTQTMELSFKEHKKAVCYIALSQDDEECLSAAEDGSCIVWNLRRGVRSNALFASTMFRSVLYHPDESQILTCGSDRKITYWDAADCSAIRVVEGSEAEIAAMDIEPDGVQFVSGGMDKLIKVWDYDEGIPCAEGIGHSGRVQRLKISPDQSRIVSVGSEGGIFIWTMPAPRGAAGGGDSQELSGGGGYSD